MAAISEPFKPVKQDGKSYIILAIILRTASIFH